jgi:hypothetical protein
MAASVSVPWYTRRQFEQRRRRLVQLDSDRLAGLMAAVGSSARPMIATARIIEAFP